MPTNDERAKKPNLPTPAPGDQMPSAAGGTSGKASTPATDANQPPSRPEEVTSVPIGVPDSAEAFRQQKERARRPSRDDGAECADDTKEE